MILEAVEQYPDAFIMTTEKDAVKLCNSDDFPAQLRTQMFYECIGMMFVAPANSNSIAARDALCERLNNEIISFNNDTYIRGC